MSEDRQHIDPITAEHLVRGVRAGAHGPDPLARLLAAAATPARRGELAGEDAAVMAFRDANLALTPESRRRSMLSSALAKLATAKVAVAVIAVSGGGVALAAGSGHLPGVDSSNDHHPSARPGTNATASHHETGSSASPGSSPATSHKSTAPNGGPSPNLRGLCTAFTAGAGDNPGKALDNPAFTLLITAAGGKDQVSSYCTTLLGAAPGKSSTHPGADPTHGAPSTHPTGAPSTHPTGAPTTHPTGPKSTPSHPTPTPPTTHGH
ncbi:MAG TPA: hypothetical protein VGL39_18985 [Jatrophihabitantaceae bacterium]|jgi:hypothetical protein